MAQSIQSLFTKLEVFDFLIPDDYPIIEKYMFRYEYEASKYVFKEGAHGAYMFFIVDGQAEVSQLVRGNKITVATLEPGRSLGEMSLFGWQGAFCDCESHHRSQSDRPKA